MAKKMDAVEKLTYEQALTELEKIVNSLENGSQNLKEVLAQFEHGKALLQHCQQLLEDAELKVRKLTNKRAQRILNK